MRLSLIFLSLSSLAWGSATYAPCEEGASSTFQAQLQMRAKIVRARWRNFRNTIPRAEFTNIRPLINNEGVALDDTDLAEYKGKTVVLKALRKSAAAREAAYYRALWDEGLGLAPFVGITRSLRSNLGFTLVTEYIPNTVLCQVLLFGNFPPDVGAHIRQNHSFRYSTAVAQGIRATVMRLSQLGIYAADLQFLISAEGQVFLIDLEGFEHFLRPPEKLGVWNMQMAEELMQMYERAFESEAPN